MRRSNQIQLRNAPPIILFVFGTREDFRWKRKRQNTRALQTLREAVSATEIREAFGVRAYPAAFHPRQPGTSFGCFVRPAAGTLSHPQELIVAQLGAFALGQALFALARGARGPRVVIDLQPPRLKRPRHPHLRLEIG